MKRNTAVIFVPVIVVVCGAVLLFFLLSLPKSAAAPSENATSTSGKVMGIEDYVRQNISTLSPQKAVLGGTFQVTNVQYAAKDATHGTGVVSYEDGHVAYTADFAYSIGEHGAITVTSFKIRK